MKRIHLLIGAFVLALLVGLGYWAFPKLFKQVDIEISQPPTGEAAYNRLYALKLALAAHGEKVSAWPNLAGATHKLGKHDTLLLYDRPDAMTQAQAQALLDWVGAGGHLVMPGPRSAATPGPLASALGLRAVAPPEDQDASDDDGDAYSDCVRLRSPAQPAPKDEFEGNWLCDARFLPTIAGYAVSGGDERKGYRFARRELGEGMVTISQLNYLDNESLREAGARELAFQLLAPSLGRGHIHLVYSADVPSLFRLLLEHAFTVLLPLALALVAWLLFRGHRLGPLQPAPEPRRRALLEHVNAAGEFAWGRHRAAALHAAVLRLFRQRLQRRSPEIFALAGEAQDQALANATSLPLARVREALRPQDLNHPNVYTQSIATLLQMRSRL
jgi:hypothetical protein